MKVKKTLLVGLLVALVLSLGVVLPASASNVVSNEKGQDTQVNKWIFDDGTNYYEVQDVFHFNYHTVVYADGSMKTDVQYVFQQQARGYGFLGDYARWQSNTKYSWNDNVGNGEVSHTILVNRHIDEYTSWGSQVIFHYANGEVRVDVTRIR